MSRIIHFGALLLALSQTGCGVNYHMRPNGACPGASPFASNCPAPAGK